MQTLRHLVCGTDFSECAQRALELAIALASATAARLTVVHVCELADLDDRHLLVCGEALSELVARHRRAGVAVDGVLRSGKPWTKLDNVATEVGAGLIVIGRHGIGRDRSALIGSVADHLVRSASRPVLTVTCNVDTQ